MFHSVLIANRGEIACRVLRTARRLGMRTVAVYSDADARAQHVMLADEAHRLGPPPARESYLDAERIVEAARRSGAAAIHPGYGFLSENAGFAERCAAAGIAFVGPPPAAIRAMGDKSAAKAIMEKAGVPLVPGYHGDNQDPRFLLEQARAIGFPVLIKASAGGGGRGMRVVRAAADFEAALESCRREARSAFGDERVLVERYLERPRHIEIQVFADMHGGCVHLYERDCSVQRRHQKVIEEAPAPGLSADMRREMGAAAVSAARAIGYSGAGTVEFIAQAGDARPAAFHFMEMNTRLQVEHPVTEMITGLDLVEWQFRVAAGERLPLAQEAVPLHGHAFEARIYAEDPANDFLPSIGRIAHLALPEASDRVRIDAGFAAGDTVTPHYDALLAKLIVHDRDRGAALARLQRALQEVEVVGPETNVGFLIALARHPAFQRGEVHTAFIEEHRADLFGAPEPAGATGLALATLAALLDMQDEARERAHRSPDPWSPWNLADAWRLNEEGEALLHFSEPGREHAIAVRFRKDAFEVELEGARRRLAGSRRSDGRLVATLDGTTLAGRVVRQGAALHVFLAGRHHRLEIRDPLAYDTGTEGAGSELVAPMPGRIIAVLVEPGSRVEKGQPLLILEAMKMEHTIAAPAAGAVGTVHYGVGDQVAEGAELIAFEPAGAPRPATQP